jgi:hypothetical protein
MYSIRGDGRRILRSAGSCLNVNIYDRHLRVIFINIVCGMLRNNTQRRRQNSDFYQWNTEKKNYPNARRAKLMKRIRAKGFPGPMRRRRGPKVCAVRAWMFVSIFDGPQTLDILSNFFLKSRRGENLTFMGCRFEPLFQAPSNWFCQPTPRGTDAVFLKSEVF